MNKTVLGWIMLIVGLALIVIANVIDRARADPLDRPQPDPHHERDWSRPHYWSSWERTQRGYLPSYQYELERRRVCGSFCDDLRRYPR